MLRTNLATRPFYNDRSVRVGIAIVGIVVAVFTAVNVMQIVALNARHEEMSQRAQEAERRTAEYRKQAQAIRQALNTQEMEAVRFAAQQANSLIERRVFSWTDLFNQFERTLPADVRIGAVEPQIDTQGRLLIAITVFSRDAADLNEFMDRLETSGRFREVLSRQDAAMDEGLMRSIVQGYYDPTPAPQTAGAPAASDSEGVATNQSAERPSGNVTPPTIRGER
jgi:Tfp pilus assembly protein PilN